MSQCKSTVITRRFPRYNERDWVQRMQVEILLTGEKCRFNVSFVLTEIGWVSFSGGYGITRGCVFVVLSKF